MKQYNASASSFRNAVDVVPKVHRQKILFPSLPCITQDDDDNKNPDNKDNTPILPCYSLRSQANILANSVIVEEPPNVINVDPSRK